MEPPNYFNSLPRVTIAYLFSFFPKPDLKNIGQVCKGFRDLVDEQILKSLGDKMPLTPSSHSCALTQINRKRKYRNDRTQEGHKITQTKEKVFNVTSTQTVPIVIREDQLTPKAQIDKKLIELLKNDHINDLQTLRRLGYLVTREMIKEAFPNSQQLSEQEADSFYSFLEVFLNQPQSLRSFPLSNYWNFLITAKEILPGKLQLLSNLFVIYAAEAAQKNIFQNHVSYGTDLLKLGLACNLPLRTFNRLFSSGAKPNYNVVDDALNRVVSTKISIETFKVLLKETLKNQGEDSAKCLQRLKSKIAQLIIIFHDDFNKYPAEDRRHVRAKESILTLQELDKFLNASIDQPPGYST